jgi:hypothetical protein
MRMGRQTVFVSGGKRSLSMVAKGLCQWWQTVFVNGGSDFAGSTSQPRCSHQSTLPYVNLLEVPIYFIVSLLSQKKPEGLDFHNRGSSTHGMRRRINTACKAGLAMLKILPYRQS